MTAMRRPSIIAALAALLALAGCGGAPATPPKPSPNPTPPPATATVTQYASALNGPLASFKKTWDTYQEQCVVEQNQVVCDVSVLTVNATAGTIALTIDGARTSTSRVYVGPPPGEIAALVDRTYADAERVKADTADNEHPADGWQMDVSALTGDIASWGPYLS